MTTVLITLPSQLAREAQRTGLPSHAASEKWLPEKHDKQLVEELFATMDRIAAVDEPAAMSPEEVAEEIAAMPAERRDKAARSYGWYWTQTSSRRQLCEAVRRGLLL